MAGILKVDRIQEANSGQGVELSHKLVDTSGNTIISENNGVATFGSSVAPSTNYTFRNKIINGNLKSARVINQRGASSITGATGYTYDRWYYDGSTYLYQGIEDLNVNNGTYCVSWVGSDITAEYLLSTDTTANNGWDGTGTFQTVANGGTFTVNESPEHGKHLWIRFSGTLSNLDKVMVEEGTVPTPFEHRHYGVELSLCQRYYEKSTEVSEQFPLFKAREGDRLRLGTIQYKVTKRATPSIVLLGANGDGGGTPSAASIDIYAFRAFCTSTGDSQAPFVNGYSAEAEL